MKDYVQNVKDLRENNVPHHNCAQAILVTFSEEMNLTDDQTRAMGAHFGAGMGCGSTCGVLTGALMTLGLLGYSKEESSTLLRNFHHNHGSLECRTILAQIARLGIDRSTHCDNLIFEAVQHIASLENRKNTKESEKMEESDTNIEQQV